MFLFQGLDFLCEMWQRQTGSTVIFIMIENMVEWSGGKKRSFLRNLEPPSEADLNCVWRIWLKVNPTTNEGILKMALIWASISLAPLTTLAISGDLKYDDEFIQTAKVKMGGDGDLKWQLQRQQHRWWNVFFQRWLCAFSPGWSLTDPLWDKVDFIGNPPHPMNRDMVYII